MRVVVVLTLLAALSCQNRELDRLPAATEVFQLRSECSDLGRKMQVNHSGLHRDYDIRVLSHYDPRTGHCYLRETTKVSSPIAVVITNDLYDGLTGEKLASSMKVSGVAVKPSGYAKPGLLTFTYGEDEASYKAAEELIEKLMMEARK